MASRGAAMKSIWQETGGRPAFAPLKSDLQTDVLIVGGGLAGLLCALLLTRAGVSCALVEADRICCGVTAGTTAKITVQHGFFADQLLRRFGEEKAKMYLEANAAAMAAYHELLSGIDSDYGRADSIVFTRRGKGAAEAEAKALDRLGVQADVLDVPPLPVDCSGAVRIRDQAQFHPLKFAFAVAPELNIFEHTRILSLAPGTATTMHGRIRAEHIIIATHFPMLNRHGSYFMKLYQHRSYVLALKNAGAVPAMAVDEDDAGLSFRQCGDLLLLGGGGHRTGKAGGGWQELRQVARQTFPKAQEAAYWSAQDCMTLDGVPYIGQYSRHAPGLYVATGFNKWGMTGAMVSAMLLRDQLLGRPNDCAAVFSPSRSILHPQLAVNITETTLHLLSPTAPRCPHLGCALKYNKQEHSWDCPCHGSRFAEDGALLDNPATSGLKGKRAGTRPHS